MQITGYVPTFVGVITSSVSWPGSASDFWPNCGTQNEWMTSSAVSVQLHRAADGKPQLGRR